MNDTATGDPTTAIETIRTILESVLEETEGADVHFKLRSALQLLVFLEERHDLTRTTLADAELDGGTRDALRELGYLD